MQNRCIPACLVINNTDQKGSASFEHKTNHLFSCVMQLQAFISSPTNTKNFFTHHHKHQLLLTKLVY